ncbi:MAG: helix-turn-helix transcriptional regulator [Acidimicrobiales bacterium]
MNRRIAAPDRMRRVLAVVPWIVANPGHTVDEIAARFGLGSAELLDDLNVVYLVGLPPYSPDALIDVEIDPDGRVTIRLADYFSRPLRLSPAQGLAVLASSEGLASLPGQDPAGALGRALAKLAAALGVDSHDPIDVHLGSAEPAMIDDLRQAVAEQQQVNLTYYSYGRDHRSERRVDPWRVFADSGAWYLQGWCHQAGGERIFRIDRIETIERVDDTVTRRPPAGVDATVTEPARVFHPAPDDPTVVLRLAPAAAWVADAYPVTVIERRDDGSQDVELVVSAVPWLERLLLRAGPAVGVVAGDGVPCSEGLAAAAARRVLDRYRRSEPPRGAGPG